MPLDPEKVAECRAWLGRAWADLDSAGILLGADRPRPDTALFHCQQAAEKAWKAFLFWSDVPFRQTHNLRELGEACARASAPRERRPIWRACSRGTSSKCTAGGWSTLWSASFIPRPQRKAV